MRCPVCRAENSEGPQCRRCRADLSLLFRLEGQRRRVLEEACGHLARGQVRQAEALVEQAAALRADEETQRLRAVIHLVRGDYGRAKACYDRLTRPQQTRSGPP